LSYPSSHKLSRSARSQRACPADEPELEVSKRGWLIKYGLAAALVAFYAFDALLLSSKGVSLVCGQLPSKWQLHPPCPGEHVASASDPRALLRSQMGIEWSERNFWDAVKRGDERAVTLFFMEGKQGMSISSAGLHQVLVDREYFRNLPKAAFLAVAQEKNEGACSSDDVATEVAHTVPAYRSVSRFVDYARDQDVAAFVAEFCKGSSLVSDLRRQIAWQQTRMAQIERENEATRRERDGCAGNLGSHAVRVRLGFLTRSEEQKQTSEATKTISVGDLILSEPCRGPGSIPRNARERKLCAWLGKSSNVSDGYLWAEAIRKFCDAEFPTKIDTSRRDALMPAVEIYDR